MKKRKVCLGLGLWPSGETECPSEERAGSSLLPMAMALRDQREQWGRSGRRRWAGAVGESQGNPCEEASGSKRPNLLFRSRCSFLDGSRTRIYGSGRATLLAGGGTLLSPRRLLATNVQRRFLIFGLAGHTKHYPPIAEDDRHKIG